MRRSGEFVAWVGAEILPHEGALRAWLRRTGAAAHEVDDIVQEAYCRIAALPSVGHICNGRAYLFQTARHVAVERVRKSRVVRLDLLTEIELANVADVSPSPERIAEGRRQLRQVAQIIEGLPEKCREIFKLRRIEGVSQKEIARRLGVSENVVEMQSVRALRLILAALEGAGADRDERPAAHDDKKAHSPGGG